MAEGWRFPAATLRMIAEMTPVPALHWKNAGFRRVFLEILQSRREGFPKIQSLYGENRVLKVGFGGAPSAPRRWFGKRTTMSLSL